MYRYGVPLYITTGNGKPFIEILMTNLCEKFKFVQQKSSMHYPLVNGLAEEFKKMLYNLLKKVVSKSKRLA